MQRGECMIQIKEDTFLVYPYERLECVSERQMVIQIKKKRLMIQGKKLRVNYLSPTEISGKGEIEEVQFLPI